MIDASEMVYGRGILGLDWVIWRDDRRDDKRMKKRRWAFCEFGLVFLVVYTEYTCAGPLDFELLVITGLASGLNKQLQGSLRVATEDEGAVQSSSYTNILTSSTHTPRLFFAVQLASFASIFIGYSFIDTYIMTNNAADRRNDDLYRDYIDDRNAKSQDTLYCTSNGVPYPHPYESQRAGENGPLLLQDFHLVDLLSHFDRERIPERVVHAKGSGAHGYYRTTESLEDLCLADIFKAGKSCPITIRFSTVGGESGSHDCARDPRGFAVKFRTDEGNWDMVANNTPVFFLRDPAKFPHFIHTQKRHPATNLSGSDDSTMFWDYLSQNPESIHQVMVLMGDRGIPDGYRFMHGYSGHTFKLVNKKGDWVYC